MLAITRHREIDLSGKLIQSGLDVEQLEQIVKTPRPQLGYELPFGMVALQVCHQGCLTSKFKTLLPILRTLTEHVLSAGQAAAMVEGI